MSLSYKLFRYKTNVVFFSLHSWLGVIIYLLLLFIVTVVLLNILIAQFSKSYEEETERAQINVIYNKIEIIQKQEKSLLRQLFMQVSIHSKT